jgi:hypothetical protein
MLQRMATPTPKQTSSRYHASMVRRLAMTVASLVVLGFIFGWGYDWATPRFYGPDRTPTFRLGVLHGALMPVALPSLCVGKDVPIYLPNQPNRLYKLGYVAGVNLCGLLFFVAVPRLARKPSGVD